MSFLDDMPELLADALGDDFRDAVLTRFEPGQGGSVHDPAEPTPVRYPCKAIHDEWSASYRTGKLVQTKDWKILILAATLPGVQPRENDLVELEDVSLTVYSDGGQPAVTSDPANATWVLRCRT